MTTALTTTIKNPLFNMDSGLIGGSERIRTAVGAFAELSLATRPRNLLFLLAQPIRQLADTEPFVFTFLFTRLSLSTNWRTQEPYLPTPQNYKNQLVLQRIKKEGDRGHLLLYPKAMITSLRLLASLSQHSSSLSMHSKLQYRPG